MNKKNLVIMLIICTVTLAFAGCTNMARVDYDKRINTAFGQLQNGQPTQAIRNLTSDPSVFQSSLAIAG